MSTSVDDTTPAHTPVVHWRWVMGEPEDRNTKDEPPEVPRPEPGTTAPLDDLTEEEEKGGPMGVMPGAGPEADEIRHSGVEEQEKREEREEQEEQREKQKEERGDG
jgi:hypothetical protein